MFIIIIIIIIRIIIIIIIIISPSASRKKITPIIHTPIKQTTGGIYMQDVCVHRSRSQHGLTTPRADT